MSRWWRVWSEVNRNQLLSIFLWLTEWNSFILGAYENCFCATFLACIILMIGRWGMIGHPTIRSFLLTCLILCPLDTASHFSLTQLITDYSQFRQPHLHPILMPFSSTPATLHLITLAHNDDWPVVINRCLCHLLLATDHWTEEMNS